MPELRPQPTHEIAPGRWHRSARHPDGGCPLLGDGREALAEFVRG